MMTASQHHHFHDDRPEAVKSSGDHSMQLDYLENEMYGDRDTCKERDRSVGFAESQHSLKQATQEISSKNLHIPRRSSGELHRTTSSVEKASSAASEEEKRRRSQPCHAAGLVLVSVNATLAMGHKTNLVLCPNGAIRKTLTEKFKQFKSQGNGEVANLELEDDDNSELVEVDDEISSGDEDEEDHHISASPLSPRNGIRIANENGPIAQKRLTEPYFAGTTSGNDETSSGSKLAFGRRKIKFFDSITAQDRFEARKILKVRLRKDKKILHDRFHEKLRLAMLKENNVVNSIGEVDSLSDSDIEDVPVENIPRLCLDIDNDTRDTKSKSSLVAALVVESLSMMPLESLEGMSRCYDGLIAAGAALLDSNGGGTGNNDVVMMTGHDNFGSKSPAMVMAALEPLLITTLRRYSGEAIRALSLLYSRCTTARYRRRFCQRIAPHLIRPPNAAIWCLRHQQDMASAVAATELLLECAQTVFSDGWYERGKLVIADTHRAEGLRSIATQLRTLSGPSPGMGTRHLPSSIQYWIQNRSVGNSHHDSSSGNQNDLLAEWEVLAVDRQIRSSIGSVFNRNWIKVAPGGAGSKTYRDGSTITTAASSIMSSVSSSTLAGGCPLSPRKTPHQQSPILLPTPTSQQQHATSLADLSSTPETEKGLAGQVSIEPERININLKMGVECPQTPNPSNENDQQSYGSIPKTPPRSTGIEPTFPTPPASDIPLSVRASNIIANVSAQVPLSPARSTSSPKAQPSPPSLSRTGGYTGSSASSYQGSQRSASTILSRSLMSSAQERKRTVAACRALRAQIGRFEEAFIQMHGRAPKGTLERAPLATTYAQYREWKRAIRHDAACRIQALMRGARCRLLVRKLQPPILSDIVGGERKSVKRDSLPLTEVARDGVQTGQHFDSQPSPQIIGSSEGDAFEIALPTSPELEIPKKIRRKSKSGGSDISAGSLTLSPMIQPLKKTKSRPSRPDENGYEASKEVNLVDLNAQKRDLKSKLKAYDMNFARQNGRMPVKAEKEPIRNLYEAYNALKAHITMLENGGSDTRRPPGLIRPNPGFVMPEDNNEDGAGSSTPSHGDNRPIANVRPSRPQPAPYTDSEQAPSTNESANTSDDLSALKAEKQTLHQMLRAFEKDFARDHNRQVNSFSDIRPVAAQYRRYKEIKKAIVALQGD
eukprot:CAMPEP_0194382050 /NCGR_PEP_ID=MMETSP0174-20130528/57718_1 /TAXON_ID=216777 /ORGANISM="Proboscia alata, Strain PI-D3" /LENGTH=1169 /DNA_ID=CAMNT_0039167005 /DNA_START=77 /DNA_END=3586 /DNA_ORIENTATION=+